MTEEKLFFKVYQDIDSVIDYGKKNYYVETEEGIKNSLPAWVESYKEYDTEMPVIEPVLMTEEEFENLPEFTGF